MVGVGWLDVLSMKIKIRQSCSGSSAFSICVQLAVVSMTG